MPLPPHVSPSPTDGAPLHADEAGAVIESEARAQNFVEHVDEARVGEHAAEGVAPRVLEGERVLAELAATLTTLQLGRVAGQACLSIGDEIGVMLDGGVGGGDFGMGENVLEYEVAVRTPCDWCAGWNPITSPIWRIPFPSGAMPLNIACCDRRRTSL